MPDDNRQPEPSLDDIATSPTGVKPSKSDVPVSIEEVNTAFVRVSQENERLKQELDALRKRVRTTEILDQLIKPSAEKAFWYMFIYSGVVGLFLFINATGLFPRPLESEVLKFLVGSTAATVIGLVGMVLTGVFLGARR